MSYLLDKKIKRKKIFKITLGVIFLIILFYFQSSIFNGLSYASEIIFHPVLVLGKGVREKFTNIGSYFSYKNYLYLQNQSLQRELDGSKARMLNYNSILAENENLKEILGRKDLKKTMVLAAILARPNQNIYDTLIIDAGAKDGIKEGNTVFVLGNVPIGRVALVYNNSSKVILFSNAGEKTQAVISGGNIFVELIGRGGGNFEIIMPKDFVLQKGDEVVLPGIKPYVLAIVEKIISDPREPFTKALLSTPVNVWELKFVEVEL